MKLLHFLFLTLLSFSLYAQIPSVENVSDAQVEQFLKEAEARGLTEQQIEAAARMNGYTAEDIAKMRQRIERVKTGALNASTGGVNAVTREQIGEVAERTDVQVDDKTEVAKKAEVYGRSIFRDKSLQFQPNLNIATPKNYVLGPGDELRIDVTGFAYQHYDRTISPEGTIQLESLSPIYLNGNTIEEAKAKIMDRLKILFGGLRNGSLALDVTLGSVRTIQVHILGEVINPGTFAISSLASPLNALYLSGGPTLAGTMRDIRILRNNQLLESIDLYKTLQEGHMPRTFLQDNDVLFIPVAKTKVELKGEIVRPMVYELKEGEQLGKALAYAGGFSEQAYRASIRLERYTAKEKKLVQLKAEDLDAFPVQNGDRVYVGAVLDRKENKVEILGAVFRPGEYALGEEIKTLGDLVQAAEGLKEDAFKGRVLIRRENERLDRELITLNLNEGTVWETPLQREDIVLIKSISELRELRTVRIYGAVVEPGEYDFQENMSVTDLVYLAGGLRFGAEPGNMEIARRIREGNLESKNVEILSYASNAELELQGDKFLLEAYDEVFVRVKPNYEEQKKVQISGEVHYPGSYVIQDKNETIADLVKRAGGVLETANLEGARYYKNDRLVALDLAEALKNNSKGGNLILQEGDRLEIPRRMDYVVVSGEVLNPTVVAYNPSFAFSDYIAQAGGFTDSAFVRKAYVRYANGLTDRTRSFLGIRDRPELARGMEIIVPKRYKYRWTPAERIAVSSATVSIATIMVTIIRLL